MTRIAIVMLCALAIGVTVVTGAKADPVVQNVKCFISDDGAGFTSADLANGSTPLEQSGQHPTPVGCGQSESAAPPTSTLNGTCGTHGDACSAHGSASATAGTTTSIPASGPAVFTATSTGTADASVSGPQSGPSATGEQSLGGIIQFTIATPSSFQISGSASAVGQNNGSSIADVILTGGAAGALFNLQAGSGSSSASGQLAPGTYLVQAFIDARARANVNLADPAASSGHDQSDASFTLTISPGGGCPADATPSVQVGLALAEGCFTERKDTQGNPTGVFETDQEAWVGGFDLRPRAGGKLVVEAGNLTSPIRSEGNGVDWVLSSSLSVPAPLGELKPFTPSFTLGANTPGTLSRLLALPLLQGLSAQVTVTWGAGGASAQVEGLVSMEDLTKNLGTAFSEAASHSIGTFTAKATLALSNNAPIDLTQAELQVPEFAVQLKDSDPPLKEGFGGAKFKASITGGSVTWSAEVTVLFPWEGSTGPNQGAVTGRLFFADSKIAGLGLGVSGFEKAIGATGWDLTGVEGNLVFSPKLSFDVGASLKEHIAFAGVPVLASNLNVKAFQLAASDCSKGKNPFEFVGTLNSPAVEEAKIGEFKGQVLMCAYVPSAENFSFEAGVSGEMIVDVGPFKKLVAAKGSATGWFQGTGNRFLSTDFNLEGNYQLTLPVIGKIAANGILSSEGYAFCGTYGFITEGFGTTSWIDPPQDLTGCDFTPFRVQLHASDIATSARVGDRVVQVPAGQSKFAIAVRGRGRAPRVSVAGPGGVAFTSSAGARALKTSRVIILPVDQLHTTYVYLRSPRSGPWRLHALSGVITRVDTARALPAPKVTARFTRLKGGKIRVTWRARRLCGQTVALVDRAAGTSSVIQGPTRRTSGTVTFTPVNPLASRRSIDAVVSINRRPRSQLVVARYRLTSPRGPGGVAALQVARTSEGLSVSWHRAAGANTYLVTVTSGGQTVVSTATTAISLVVRGAPVGPLTVTVTAVDRFGRGGRQATARLG